MKRLTTLGLAVFCVAAMAVNAAEVPSVNTVGYVKLTVAQNFNQYAFNWEVIGGAQEVSVQDLFDTDQLVGSANFFTSDRIMIWDQTLNAGAGGYVQLWLFRGGVPAFDGKWIEGSAVSTKTIARGDGFWLKHIGDPTELVVSGQVPDSDDSFQVDFPVGLAMFGSGYTADLDINAQDWSDANGSANFFTSDRIMIWDPALNGGQGGYVQLWLFEGGVPAFDGKWIEGSAVSTRLLQVGQGAWYKNVGADVVTWIQTKPYTL